MNQPMLQNLAMLGIGAVLVCLGVVAGAVADRIRGSRFTRERTSTPAAPREVREVREPRPARAKTASDGATMATTDAHQAMARDVVSTMVNAGYGRPEAIAAAQACRGSECSTIESWVRAALRRVMGQAKATA